VIYELRSYEVVPGRMGAMHARFKNHTLGLFKIHGIEVVGFWEAMIGTSNVLHYIVRFEDLAHRERAWAAFGADPEWQRVRAESERDGPIIARIRNEIWRAVPYSPMQ
jgi:NIPSNAP